MRREGVGIWFVLKHKMGNGDTQRGKRVCEGGKQKKKRMTSVRDLYGRVLQC